MSTTNAKPLSDLKNKSVTTNTAKPQNLNDFGALLAKNMKQIGSIVASTVTPEKMARIALNELRNNKTLLNAAISKPDTFVNAVMQASHLGLEIGGALGQAYLVPFKGSVTMMPGYRGLLSLARRSGQVTSINAEIVYENDTFDLSLGIEITVLHKPFLKGDRGDPILAYMVAHFKDGGHHFEWMTIEEVEKVRNRSPAANSGPWITDYPQMVKKTVIRRGWKYLPMSVEMQNAEIIESALDQGKGLIIEGDGVLVVNAEDEAINTGAERKNTAKPIVNDDVNNQVIDKSEPVSGGYVPTPEEEAEIRERETAQAEADERAKRGEDVQAEQSTGGRRGRGGNKEFNLGD